MCGGGDSPLLRALTMINYIKDLFSPHVIEIPVEVEVEVEKIVYKKDPTGLMANDLRHLKSIFHPPRVGKGVTIEEAKLAEGRYQVIEYIENKLVGGRLDARPEQSGQV